MRATPATRRSTTFPSAIRLSPILRVAVSSRREFATTAHSISSANRGSTAFGSICSKAVDTTAATSIRTASSPAPSTSRSRPGSGAIRFEDPRLPLMMAAPAQRAGDRSSRRSASGTVPAVGKLASPRSACRHRPRRAVEHQLQLRLMQRPDDHRIAGCGQVHTRRRNGATDGPAADSSRSRILASRLGRAAQSRMDGATSRADFERTMDHRGNYGGSLPLRLGPADTLVYLVLRDANLRVPGIATNHRKPR